MWAKSQTATDMPIALKKVGAYISALATSDIEVGALVIPVFFRRDNSMLTDTDNTGRSHKEVKGSVKWEIEPAPDATAEKKRTVTVTVCIQPEKRLRISSRRMTALMRPWIVIPFGTFSAPASMANLTAS